MSFKDRRTPDSSQHLTPDQIRSAFKAPPSEQPAHLSLCPACAETVRQLQLLSRKPAPESGECIPHEHLFQAAGGQRGLTSEEISHLATCELCSGQFRALSADLEDARPEGLARLKSSSPVWQAEMGRTMAAAAPSARSLPLTRWKWAFVCAGVAAIVIVAVVVITFSRNRGEEASHLLARSFEKRRLTSMRLEGAHFSPVAVTRGSSVSIADLPSEGLEAATLARRKLEKNAGDPYWNSVQGQVYLLQGAPEQAVSQFRIAQAADPSQSSYQLALGSALCDNAIQNRAPSDYLEGLNLLRQFVAGHEGDSVALYNLGVCLYHAGLLNEARNYLQQARKVEKDASWFPDIEQWLSKIDARLRSDSAQPVPDFGWQAPEEAGSALRAAIQENRSGKAAAALTYAQEAEAVARRSVDRELLLWAKFEQVYALQRLSRPRLCRDQAQTALALPADSSSKELQAALLTEAGICSDILGDFRAAEDFYSRAQKIATAANAQSLRLRLAGTQAALYDTEGLHANSERLDLDALTQSDRLLNPMRRYQFLSDLYFNAVAQRYFFAALEFEKEAQPHAVAAGNAIITASAHEDLAEACLRTEDQTCAIQEQEHAEALLKEFDQATREFYAITWSMRRELIAPGAAPLPEVKPLRDVPQLRKNHYLGLPLLLLTGYRAFHNGDLARAEQSAMAAASEVARLRRNLSDDQARFTWSQDARPVFELLVQIRLALGRTRGALECWESFQTLLRSGEAQLCASRDLNIDPETSFVIFARLRNQYVQWVLLPNGDLKQHSLLAAESIDRLSHLLTAMCAQPDSSVEAIANIAQQLSELLLPSEMGQDSSAIVFEPDGPLTQLPFRALRSRGQWLGLSNSVSVIPGLWAVKAGSLAEGVTSRLFLIGNSGDQRLELESESASANGYQTTKIANFLEIPERIDAAQLVYYVGHASEQQALQVALAVPRRLRICRFAVLAACRTRGTDSFEAGGFGILPDRLLQAGALAVVASRWDLDSEKTGQLLRPILKAGDSFTLSEELRDASRELAKAGVSHPYYWAGLDVYGVPTLKKGGYQ